MGITILNELNKSTKHTRMVAEMVKALMLGRKVSSTSCANYLSGTATKESKIRHVERFYSKEYLKQDTAISTLGNQFKGEKILLSMDRTNWEYGKSDINALIVYGCDKITSSMLNIELLDNKGGNSNFKNRKLVLDPVIAQLGSNRISALLCDREFFSFEFIRYLISKDIPFVIRLKENLTFVQELIRSLKFTAKTVKNQVIGRFKKENLIVDLSAKKLADEYLIVASYKVDSPLALYRKRWDIECFFKSIKTAGFNIEDTHLTRLTRLKSLFLLCAIAYLACSMIGRWRHNNRAPIKFKKTLNCYQFSFFRYGLDWITELIFSAANHLISNNFQYFKYCNVG
jgi:transposase